MPRGVSITVIAVYVVYGVVGALTLVETWREPPTRLFTHDLNLGVYWNITAVSLMLSGVVGIIGAWTGRWDIERPAIVLLVFATMAQSVFTFHALNFYDIRAPFFLVALAGTAGHFLTRWLRINKDYRDPAPEIEKVRLEKRAYRKALDDRYRQ